MEMLERLGSGSSSESPQQQNTKRARKELKSIAKEVFGGAVFNGSVWQTHNVYSGLTNLSEIQMAIQSHDGVFVMLKGGNIVEFGVHSDKGHTACGLYPVAVHRAPFRFPAPPEPEETQDEKEEAEAEAKGTDDDGEEEDESDNDDDEGPSEKTEAEFVVIRSPINA